MLPCVKMSLGLLLIATSLDVSAFSQSSYGNFAPCRVVSVRSSPFAAPEPIGELSVLDVARPLMDAAKALEQAGMTICSFAGDKQEVFYMGTALVNTARDLEDAGALGRSRPGIFGDEAMLKLRSSGEALTDASKYVDFDAFEVAGTCLNACGEELGRNNKQTSAKELTEAGEALISASLTCRKMQLPIASSTAQRSGLLDGIFGGEDKKSSGSDAGFLAGITKSLIGGPSGTWVDAADDISKAGNELRKAGGILGTCRVAKRMAR